MSLQPRPTCERSLNVVVIEDVMNHDRFRRYRYIDALRGIAVIGVVVVHVANSLVIEGSWLNTLLSSGSRGVQLFYLVSSLTIFMSLVSRRERGSVSWTTFFARRFFRIAPMFYLTALYFILIDGGSARYFAPDGIEWWTVPLTFTFLHGWHPETINSLVPGGWSIAVEFTFYMMIPFFFAKLSSPKRAILFTLATYLLMLILNFVMSAFIESMYAEDRLYLSGHFFSFWLFSQLPVFCMGILSYYLLAKFPEGDKRLSLAFFIGFLVVFYIFSFKLIDSEYLPMHIGCAVAFVLLLFSLHCHAWTLIVNPLTIWLGKISFSIYLVHFIVIKRTSHFVVPQLSDYGNLAFIIYFGIVMTLTTAIAYVCYHLIEQKGVEVGRRISESNLSIGGMLKKFVSLR